jgi:hypothetical protein
MLPRPKQEKAKPIRADVWEQHKARIIGFVRDGVKIKDLPEFMKLYGLDAKYVVATKFEVTLSAIANSAQG